MNRNRSIELKARLEALERIREAEGNFHTPEAIHALSAVLLALGRMREPDPYDLALISGMVAAVLTDYAAMLADDRVEVTQA